MKINRRTFLVLLILTIIGLAVFWKTFQLEIYGDEWEGIWWTTSTLQTSGHFNDRIAYKPYELAVILLNVVSGASGFSYNSTNVYVFSFLTRLFAVFCLYYFLTERKLSRKAAFIGSVLFLITPIGIQTTDWAKNFTSYISIGFFLIALNFIYQLTTFRRILIFLIFFLLAVYVNPIRAPGVIFTIIFLLIIKFIFQSKERKKLLISLGLVFFILVALSKMSLFGIMSSVQSSYMNNMFLLANNLNLAKIGGLFVFIGRGVLPNPSPVSLALLLILLIYWRKNLLIRKKILIFLIPVMALPLMLFSPSSERYTMLLGYYFTLILVLTSMMELMHRKISGFIDNIIPLLLNLFSIFIPFLLGRADVADFTHRYLIYSALSIPIIVAFSLKDFENRYNIGVNLKSVFLCICFIIAGTFIITTKFEIDGFYRRHNQVLARAIWAEIKPYFNNFDFKHHRPVVYLDGADGGVLHNSVSFGFGYHVGFIYRIWDYDHLPIAVDSEKDLISLITDGKAGQKYIQKEAIFPKEDALYLKIEGTKVVNIYNR